MKRSRKRILLLATTGTILPLLGVGAATASFLPGGVGDEWQQWVLDQYPNPLEQILGQLEQSNPILETIMEVALGEDWRESLDATSKEGDENGNLPDPYEVRTTEASTDAGILTTSPIVRQRDLANLYDQETARAMAAPVLGETGQSWLEDEAERISALVESSHQGAEQAQQLAEAAQGLSVTQDVMKQSAQLDAAIATLLSNQTQLSADNHTALLQVQRMQGIIAQLSANTSEGIDETNRRARVERQISLSTSTHAPVYIPGLLGTGKTQADQQR